jgi:DNA-binding transcriptional ArsR family regulator
VILALNEADELSVQALADTVATTQQNASSHLGLLARAGLLRRRQEGRQAWYALASPASARLIEEVKAEIMAELGAAGSRPPDNT